MGAISALRFIIFSALFLVLAACATSSKPSHNEISKDLPEDRRADRRSDQQNGFVITRKESSQISANILSLEGGSAFLAAAAEELRASISDEPNEFTPVQSFTSIQADPQRVARLQLFNRKFGFGSFVAVWVLKDENLQAQMRKRILDWARVYKPAGDATQENSFRGLAIAYAYLKDGYSEVERSEVTHWFSMIVRAQELKRAQASASSVEDLIFQMMLASTVGLAIESDEIQHMVQARFANFIESSIDRDGYVAFARAKKDWRLNIISLHHLLTMSVELLRAGLITKPDYFSDGKPLFRSIRILNEARNMKGPDWTKQDSGYAIYAFQVAAYIDPAYATTARLNAGRRTTSSPQLSLAYYSGLDPTIHEIAP